MSYCCPVFTCSSLLIKTLQCFCDPGVTARIFSKTTGTFYALFSHHPTIYENINHYQKLCFILLSYIIISNKTPTQNYTIENWKLIKISREEEKKLMILIWRPLVARESKAVTLMYYIPQTGCVFVHSMFCFFSTVTWYNVSGLDYMTKKSTLS